MEVDLPQAAAAAVAQVGAAVNAWEFAAVAEIEAVGAGRVVVDAYGLSHTGGWRRAASRNSGP